MKLGVNIFLLVCLVFFAGCTSGNKESNSNAKETSKQKEGNEKVMGEASVDLTKHGIADNPNNVLGGLKVGDKAPDFELENEHGELISLKNKLEDGPVLLVFYRADWCSICRKHLAKFQDKIMDIKAEGIIDVIAISPQKKEYSLALHEEHMYNFPILSDIDHKTMKDYKVFFHVTDKYNQYIKEVKGDPIELRNGDKEPVMPVPATYMIGQDQRIKYVHYDPNYRVRADIDEALSSINN